MKNITSNKYFIPGFAVVVFLLVALVLVVFRGGVPDDAVAAVDGNAIPISDFNKTLKVNAAQSGGVVPDPPDYTKCIAGKKKTSPKLSQSALKTQCQKDWDTAKDTIMTSLVQAKWFELEAEDRGINISDARSQGTLLAAQDAVLPEGSGLPEVPQAVQPDRGRPAQARARKHDPGEGAAGGHDYSDARAPARSRTSTRRTRRSTPRRQRVTSTSSSTPTRQRQTPPSQRSPAATPGQQLPRSTPRTASARATAASSLA